MYKREYPFSMHGLSYIVVNETIILARQTGCGKQLSQLTLVLPKSRYQIIELFIIIYFRAIYDYLFPFLIDETLLTSVKFGFFE